MIPRRMLLELAAERAGEDGIYEFDPSILNDCPMMLGSRDDMSGILIRKYLKDNRLDPPIRARAENIETLIMLCVKGVGACLCPESLIRSTLTKEQIEELSIIAPDIHTPVKFATRKEGYQWTAIEEFKKLAHDNIEAIMNLNDPVKRNNRLSVAAQQR
jgi:DNA-binding transcriptional LysR family regulator